MDGINKFIGWRGFWFLAAASILLISLSPLSSAIVHPLSEEALEAYNREKTVENYRRMVSEKTAELSQINDLILENPNLYEENTRKIVGYFIGLLQGVYVLSILSAGIYLIFFSGSPESRAKTKKFLFISVTAMALIVVSTPLLSLFFGLSRSLTSLVLSFASVDTEKPFAHAAEFIFSEGGYVMFHRGPSGEPSGVERAGFPLIFLSYFILELMLLLIRIRTYMVALFAMIFPLTITFYAFPPLRGAGRFLVEQTILWTLAQAAMALVLVVVSVGVYSTSIITSFVVSDMLLAIIEVAGLIMLALTPPLFVKWFSGFT